MVAKSFIAFSLLFLLAGTQIAQACLTGADDPAYGGNCDWNISNSEMWNYIGEWYKCSSCLSDIFNSIQGYYGIPFCGDGSCDSGVGEDCPSCPSDCTGCATPTPALPSGYIGYWKFENNLSDSSGYGNDGSCTSCPGYANGQVGQALSLDGSTSFITAPKTGSGLDITGAEATISAWVYSNDPSHTGFIAGVPADGAHRNQYSTRVDGGTQTRFYIQNSTNLGNMQTNSASFTPNAWVHVASVYDGSDMRTYYNGVLMGTPNAFSGNIASNAFGDFHIGSHGAGMYFNGLIDEVMVYDRALSQAEVQSMFIAQGGMNCSTDADNDGYYTEGANCGPVDCDDGDVSINPGVIEICGNGVDENCNGMADDVCLPCAILGGALCNTNQSCMGGSFVSSAEGTNCCVGGICQIPPVSEKQRAINVFTQAGHAYWDQRVVVNVSGNIFYGYSGAVTLVNSSDPDDRWYDSDGTFMPEPHIHFEWEDTTGHPGVGMGFVKAYEKTQDKFMLRAAKAIGDTLLDIQNSLGCGGWWYDMGPIGYDRIWNSPTQNSVVDFGEWKNFDCWGGHCNVVINNNNPPFNSQDVCNNDGVSWVGAAFLLRLYQAMPASDPDRDKYLAGAKWFADDMVGLKDVVDPDFGFKPYDIGGIAQIWPYSVFKYRTGGDAQAGYPYSIPHNLMPTTNDGAIKGSVYFLTEFWEEAKTNPQLDETKYLDGIRLNIDYLIHVFDLNANPNGRGSWSSQWWINDGTSRAGTPTWGRAMEPPSFSLRAGGIDDVLINWWKIETNSTRKTEIEGVLRRYMLYFKYDALPINHPTYIALANNTVYFQPYMANYDPSDVGTWWWWIWYNHNASAAPLNVPTSSTSRVTPYYLIWYDTEAFDPNHYNTVAYPMIRSIGNKIAATIDNNDTFHLYDGFSPDWWLNGQFGQDREHYLFRFQVDYSYSMGDFDYLTGFFGGPGTYTASNGKTYQTVSDWRYSSRMDGINSGFDAQAGPVVDSDGDGYLDTDEISQGTDEFDSEVYPGHEWHCGDGTCQTADEDKRTCAADC